MDDFHTILVPIYLGGTTETKVILNFGSNINAVIIHDVAKSFGGRVVKCTYEDTLKIRSQLSHSNTRRHHLAKNVS